MDLKVSQKKIIGNRKNIKGADKVFLKTNSMEQKQDVYLITMLEMNVFNGHVPDRLRDIR